MAYVLLAIVYLVSPFVNKEITNTIENSYITKNLYNNNIVLKVIM